MKINDNYLVLNVIEVKQLQNGIVFTGKITFEELKGIYKLTERKESIEDPMDNSTIFFKEEGEQFQRQLSEKKLKEIQSYLKNEILLDSKGKSLGLFPSSIILYNRSYDIDDLVLNNNEKENFELTEKIIQDSYQKELDCCFYLKESDDFYKLYIPQNSRITLIVDGQHRFIGTKLFFDSLKTEAEKKKIEDFEFIMTYLTGFDLYEIGQIFATVNFKQKPVNRSLYYDIFGSAPQTDREGNLQNEIRLAHDLALHLNNNSSSPIQGMIKLLGKGFGLFSQAFFVEKMIRIFRSKIWDSYIISYINGSNEYKEIAIFMKEYFEAMKEAYPSAWPQLIDRHGKEVYSSYFYKFILCKTTGLGAFLRLLIDIYPNISYDRNNYKKKLLEIFNKISDSEAKQMFSKLNEFGGAGSEGLQLKLYKELKEKFNIN